MRWQIPFSPSLFAFVGDHHHGVRCLPSGLVKYQCPYTVCPATTTASAENDVDNSSNDEILPIPSLDLIGFRIDGSKYDALLEWLRGQEDAVVSSKLVIQPSELGGYGVFCQDTVEEDELLFAIPRKACITSENALQDSVCGRAFKTLIEKAGPGGNTVALAGILARERLRSVEALYSGSSKVEDSVYGPYLATLPWERGTNNQEHPLFWSDQDVETLLGGTMGYDEIKSLRGEVDLAIQVLNGIVGDSIRELRGQEAINKPKPRWPWEQPPTEAELAARAALVDGLPEAVKGAFVSMLTRSFQDQMSDDEDEEGEKLVPLLDMLQHSDEPNVSHVMVRATGRVEVRARRAMVAGEELLNQYRSETEESMPYHRFFTRFGFVPGITEPIENLLRDKSPIFVAQKAEV